MPGSREAAAEGPDDQSRQGRGCLAGSARLTPPTARAAPASGVPPRMKIWMILRPMAASRTRAFTTPCSASLASIASSSEGAWQRRWPIGMPYIIYSTALSLILNLCGGALGWLTSFFCRSAGCVFLGVCSRGAVRDGCSFGPVVGPGPGRVGFGALGGQAVCGRMCRKSRPDAGGSEPVWRAGVFPGAAPVRLGCECAGEAVLGVGGEDEPGPAVGGFGECGYLGRSSRGSV